MLTPYVQTSLTLDKCKVGKIVPFLKMVARPHGLKINKVEDLKVARRILVNSILYN